ncbi:MAG: MFS transporter [Planctomycetaceae bacterium]
MAYTQLTLCPVSIEFARHLGGTSLHVGILGAVPACMLFLQFVSAVVANHLTYRRRLWMTTAICQRLSLVPLAFAPLLWRSVPDVVWLWLFLALTAVNQGLLHFATPLWMSWMGDLLPKRGLSRFWGRRHLWMQWAGAATLFLAAGLMKAWQQDIRTAFAIIMSVAAVLGVADILMFLRVHEPPVTKLAETRLRTVLAEPFRNREFRSFIRFMCFWHFAAMTGAPFISLFLLAEIRMDLSHLMLLWMFCWIGGALCSGYIGRLVERFGHRPMLVISTALKSTNMLALLLIPCRPDLAFRILIPVFVVDSILNAVFAVATNGFLLTKSPAGNRTMYIAAGTALAGLIGGLTSVVCGAMLTVLPEAVSIGPSLQLTPFRCLFAVSILLRFAALLLVVRIREPEAQTTRVVISELMGVSPLRLFRFPTGLFRSVSPLDASTDPAEVPPVASR